MKGQRHTFRPCDTCQCQEARQWARGSAASDTPEVTLSTGSTGVCGGVWVYVSLKLEKKKRKTLSTLDLWSVVRQILFELLWVPASWRGTGKDFEGFRPVWCWHLVVASSIDRRTLGYWLVCWKAHVSLHFQQSTGLWLYVQYKCHPRNTTGRAHHGLYWSFYAAVCLIFAVSLPRLQQILCIHVWILMFTCLNLVLLLLQLFSLIPVCDSHWVTHCQAASLYNLLWFFTSPVSDMLVHPNYLFPHKSHVFFLSGSFFFSPHVK